MARNEPNYSTWSREELEAEDRRLGELRTGVREQQNAVAAALVAVRRGDDFSEAEIDALIARRRAAKKGDS